MKSGIRGLILLFMILYFISPIDGMPGLIDDIIIMLVGSCIRGELKEES